MINLYDGNITDILPEAIAEKENVIALGYAIQQGLRRLIEYCKNISVYAVIDIIPDEVLDMLALELDTQYYEDTLDIDVKRRLVKNTLIWYISAGTPAAVEELVAVVFGEGEISEWFEYGGEPYRFKIKTNAFLTENMIAYFSEMLRRVKNARSHIEAIEIHRTIDQALYAGIGSSAQYKPAPIIEACNINRITEQTIYSAVGDQQISYSRRRK